jgi:FtsH-binding integral membrane protein
MQSFLGMPKVDLKAVFKLNDIPTQAQNHLTRVYFALSLTTLAAVIGATLLPTIHLNPFVSLIVSIGLMCGVIMTEKTNQTKKCAFLLAFGVFTGFQLNPAITMIGKVKPQILTTALVYTLALFSSFTALSLFSKRRSWLFLGGIISTIMNCLFITMLASWLFGLNLMSGMFYIMVSLFMACMYVIYDTQIIIERASAHKDYDVAGHALMLFVDLVELFIRILQILMESDKKKEKK